MTPDLQAQFETIENNEPSLHKIDKKLTIMIINVNDMLEKYHEHEMDICKIKKKITWAQGWIAGAAGVITVLVFIGIKLWDKVYGG